MSSDLLKKMVIEGRSRGKTWRQIRDKYYKKTGKELSIAGLRSTACKRGWIISNLKEGEMRTRKRETQEDLTITTISTEPQPVEEIIKRNKIDLKVWMVDKHEVTSWTTPLGGKSSGTGEPEVIVNHRTFVRFKPRPKDNPVKKALEDLKSELTNKKVIIHTKKKKIEHPIIMFLGIFDLHFGKLAWALEAGADYDLKIARDCFVGAAQDLLDRSAGYDISQIVFPIGNDYFQIDNFIDGKIGATTKGTPQDTDGRMAKILREGMLAMIEVVELCAAVAPLEVIWIPGNHDWNTSFALANIVDARFHADPNIKVDVTPSPRKYRRYGKVLVGMTHGNEEKHSDLPLIMAGEAKKDWAKAEDYIWFLGHFHRRKELYYNAGAAFGAVRVKILPSLSATDAWHHKKGYVMNDRAAEAYYFDPTEGYIGHTSVKVRPEFRGKYESLSCQD